jgi:hypothetical protein
MPEGPVKYALERETAVKASREAVWRAVVDVEEWPKFKPMIKAVRGAQGPIGPGSEFGMKIAVKGPAMWVPVKVIGWEPPRLIAWTGGLKGLSESVHSFILEDAPEGVRLISREEFRGSLVWLMKIFVTEKDLHSLHDRWLAAIKSRCEERKL